MPTACPQGCSTIPERLRAFARQIQPWGAMAINRDPRIETYRVPDDWVNRNDVPAGMIKLGSDTLRSLDPQNRLVAQAQTYLLQVRSRTHRPGAFYYFTVQADTVRSFGAPDGVLFQLAQAIDELNGSQHPNRPWQIPPAWPRI